MAIVNGANYDHVDLQDVTGGDTTRHMLQDTAGRAMLASKEASATASAAHAPGTASQYFVYGDTLYRATDNIAIGGSIVTSGSGQNCEAVTVGDELASLNANLSYNDPIPLSPAAPSIKTNITEGNTVDIDDHGTSGNYFGVIVDCQAGDQFIITGTGGQGVRLWAFTDEDYKLLSKSTADKTLTNGILTAESDGHLICNFYKANAYSLEKRSHVTGSDYLQTKEAANAVDQNMYFPKPLPIPITDGYITTNLEDGATVDVGTLTASVNYFSLVVPCAKGDEFTLTGSGGSIPRLWAFTDLLYKLLSKATPNKTLTDGTLTAGQDGYLVCNFLRTAPYSLKKKTLINGTDFEAVMNTAVAAKQFTDGFNSAGRYMFGHGCSLDYRVTNIPALNAGATPLAYFYGLFDALVTAYPEYITKVNCDTDAGVTPAAYMDAQYFTDYPIYLYKFVPPYAPKSSTGSVTQTLADELKVMLIGGTHSEETAIFDLYQTMRLICESWASDPNLFELRFNATFYVFPCQNSWGVANGERTNYISENHPGVDLNRNMPTANWEESGSGTTTYTGPSAGSEYETQVLLHYLDELKPQIVIDHHNTALGDGAALMYCNSGWQLGKDISADHIKRMSRKWQVQYPETFGTDPTVMYGFLVPETGVGKREMYACEHGMLGITYESQAYLCYSNGGEFDDEHYEHNTAMVETLATDGFLNFLLRCLHAFSVYSTV